MTEQEREDLLTLKLLMPEIKASLNKMIENQQVLTQIKLEADDSKRFRQNIDTIVERIISQRLNTVQFEQELNKQIEKITEQYLNKQNVRDDFTSKVKGIFTDEFKHIQLSLYFKLTAIVGSVATALVIFILKGVLGDK